MLKGAVLGLTTAVVRAAYRLAAVSLQAAATGQTPLQNLATHLADPWSTTVLSNDLARVGSVGVRGLGDVAPWSS